MIKLIVTDMDGTLLNSQKELSPRFEQTYQQLSDLGIKFAVASGRPYYTLLPQFTHFKHDIIFIGDNGAYIGTRPEPVIAKCFSHDELQKIIAACRKTPDVHAVVCTPNQPYTESQDAAFLQETKKYYPSITVVDNAMLIGEKVIKVAIYDAKTWQVNSGDVWRIFEDKHMVAKSSMVWIDIMPQGIHKGAAVKHLQNIFNISEDETMVFGDFHNDIEMLQMAQHSYAMDNAHDDVKLVAKFRAPSNDSDGVIRVIEKEVLKTIQK